MNTPISLFHLEYEDMATNSSVLSQAIKIEELYKEGIRRGFLGFLMFALGISLLLLFVFLFFFHFGKQFLCVKDSDW